MLNTASELGRTLLTLSFIPGIGPRTLLKLSEHPLFAETNIMDMGKLVASLQGKLTEHALDKATDLTFDNLSQAQADGAFLVTVADTTYPASLALTHDRPALLYVKGRLQQDKTVAVIGTREPTEHGMEITRRATTHLVEQGWSIVSGLALGVDALAHRTALEMGGHTVAVLAHGLQTVAPKGHRRLAEEILDRGGALVSEYPYGTGVFPAHFVKRDRTQAGLAQGVLMVQTDVRGGSLHASRASIDYGRPLAVPVPTPRDKMNREPKVQGNLVILGGGHEAAALLKCRESALKSVVPLNSREDYPVFTAAMRARAPEQEARLL